MEISDEQLDRFIKLYEKDMGKKITRVEAQASALALIRFIRASVIPFPDDME